jgi:hypothetical protein
VILLINYQLGPEEVDDGRTVHGSLLVDDLIVLVLTHHVRNELVCVHVLCKEFKVLNATLGEDAVFNVEVAKLLDLEDHQVPQV